jgi:hypothetical protein
MPSPASPVTESIREGGIGVPIGGAGVLDAVTCTLSDKVPLVTKVEATGLDVFVLPIEGLA